MTAEQRSLVPEREPAARLDLTYDVGLYVLSAAFALVTALTSTLAPHRAWGGIASYGYAAAAAIAAAAAVFGQLAAPRRLASTTQRALLTGATWAATALLPLLVEAAQRAAGRTDRAQEEVLVIERAGVRLLHTGTPYLTRDAIAALPADERLLGYTPYQPGMALFGLPRALGGAAWWTDARVWFAVVTVIALVAAGVVLVRGGARGPALVRAGQFATVLPLCALTLATGGDDLPVLALCLLALAFAARAERDGAAWRWLTAAGVAVGVAGALKLFAWPVALVLIGYAAAVAGRRGALACGVPALGLPVLALLPAFAVNASAAVENVVRFPLGRGLLTSPAQSPLPGHLIATGLPGGRIIAAALLVFAGLGIGAWLVRRPPRDAGAAAMICAVGMAAATLLLPATRFGYLLYPVAYALAAPALRGPALRGPALPQPGRVRRP